MSHKFYSLPHISKLMLYNLLNVFYNRERSVGYKLRKVVDNVVRALMLRATIKTWQKDNREYIQSLKSM
jgi:hypothetical protein